MHGKVRSEGQMLSKSDREYVVRTLSQRPSLSSSTPVKRRDSLRTDLARNLLGADKIILFLLPIDIVGVAPCFSGRREARRMRGNDEEPPVGIIPVEQALYEMCLLLEDYRKGKRRGDEVTTSRLSGGLTNDNVLIVLAPGSWAHQGQRSSTTRKLVLRRFSSNVSQHLSYDRDDEYRNSCIAAKEKGIGAEVLGYVPPTSEHGGALALSYVEGKTMEEGSMAQLCSSQEGVKMVVTALKKLHQSPSRFDNIFDPFHARETYEEQVRHLTGGQRGVDWLMYSSLVDKLAPIQSWLKSTAEPLVDCHNDLLSANFIRSTDGQHLTIVDWELSGRAEPCWDLGNFVSENELGEEGDETIYEIVSQYWQGSSAQIIQTKVKRVRLYSFVSKITWAAWGAVLHNLAADTASDFDYADWSMQKLRRAEKELAEHILTCCKGDD